MNRPAVSFKRLIQEDVGNELVYTSDESSSGSEVNGASFGMSRQTM